MFVAAEKVVPFQTVPAPALLREPTATQKLDDIQDIPSI
jgi:hypothetical protein